MQVPLLVTSHFAPGEASVIESSVPGGHGGGGDGDGGDGGGDGGGGDGGDGGDGGCGGGAGDAQITKPPAVVRDLELDHLIVSPAAISTLLGPLVPEYCVPPMIMSSSV